MGRVSLFCNLGHNTVGLGIVKYRWVAWSFLPQVLPVCLGLGQPKPNQFAPISKSVFSQVQYLPVCLLLYYELQFFMLYNPGIECWLKGHHQQQTLKSSYIVSVNRIFSH